MWLASLGTQGLSARRVSLLVAALAATLFHMASGVQFVAAARPSGGWIANFSPICKNLLFGFSLRIVPVYSAALEWGQLK